MGGTVHEEPGDDATSSSRIYEAGTAIAGRYRVVRFVGAGGMGEVYEVEDAVLGEHIALKTLRADRETSERAVARLRREVALARKVTHRNVCRMYDVGVHEGRAFLTMELLVGETLADRARRGPLELTELATIARQLIAALAAAHAAGVVHRDFKSGNVMLVRDRAVVTDFGLARSAQAEADVSLTGDHAMIGTPAYMAPEQVEGREATPASDVYALGVVLFELATGTLPFRADTALATATARLRQRPPRPSKLRREVTAWDRTILACLALEPAARPAVLEVGPRAVRRTRWMVAGALVVAAIVAFAAWPRPPRPLPVRHWPASLRPVDTKAAAHFDAAHAARAADRRNEARQLLEQAAAASTEDPVAQAALAEVLDELGFEERARDAARRSLGARVPASEEARRFAALVDAEVRGDRATAVTAARALVALAPSERAYRMRLARALVAEGGSDARAAVGSFAPRNVKEQIEHGLLDAQLATAGGDHARAAARASRVVALAADRPHDRAAALVQLAAAQWRTGDPAAATATYERALAIARDSGDGALTFRARKGLVDLDMAADRIRAGTERTAENAALAGTLGDRALQADLLVTNTWFLTALGHPDDADRGLDAAHALTTDAVELGWIDAGRAFVRLQRGELAEAARLAEATYLTGKKLGVAGLQGNAYHTWLTAVIELDDAAAIAHARSTRTETVLRYIDAVAALREDRLDDAERAARPLVGRQTREGREAQVIVANVLVRRGKLDEASTLLDEVAPLLIGDGHSLLARRALVEARAELRARRGDPAGALEELALLQTACADAGLHFCAVRAAARAARVDPARVPAATELAEARGFRRVVRELQTSRNAATSSP